MLEDGYGEIEHEELNEAEFCFECERHQQEIYRLNRLLRAELTEYQYRTTRQMLENAVQVQLLHQRKHC